MAIVITVQKARYHRLGRTNKQDLCHASMRGKGLFVERSGDGVDRRCKRLDQSDNAAMGFSGMVETLNILSGSRKASVKRATN